MRSATARTTLSSVLAVALLGGVLLPLGATPASAAALVGIDISVIQDGTAHGTVNECLVTDPDSSLADESPTDGIVCTDDTVTFGWNYSVSAEGADDVVISQTLPAGWSWDPLSLTVCEGGADYTGVVELSVDGLTLTCTLTFPNTGSARSGQMPVFAIPEPGVGDGSTYTAELVVTDDSGPVDVDPASTVTVRSQPRWNLVKGAWGSYSFAEVDFGFGPEPATHLSFWVQIVAESANNFKGQDALQPLTFRDIVTGIDPEATLVQCPVSHVSGPSMTCTQPSGPGGDILIELPGGMAVPPQSVLPGTSGLAWHGAMTVAIPNRSLPGYPVTELKINQFVEFDPDGVSSGSNLGVEFENGSETGAECVSGNGNDNCAYINVTGPVPGLGDIYTGKSLRQKFGVYAPANCGGHWWWCMPLNGTTGTNDVNNGAQGNQDGVQFRGDDFWAGFNVQWDPNREELPANMMMCDVWDPALQQFDPNGMTGTSQEGWWNQPTTQERIQFSNQVFADDTARENADCGVWGDLADGPWYETWEEVPGGPDTITAIRWTTPAVREYNGQPWTLPMKVDDSVATGTVIPDFSHLYYDQQVDPEDNPDGWRWVNRDSFSVAELTLALDKDTVPAGQTNSVAGARVPYSLDVTAFTSESDISTELTGLRVVDTLHPCLQEPQLDPSVTGWTMSVTAAPNLGPDGLACTSDDVSGAELTFTPTSTLVSGDVIEQIVYSVVVATLVTNGQQLLNTAVVKVDDGVTDQTEAGRTDQWTLTVAAPGAVRVSKVADFPLVEIEPDDLSWTISYSNTLGSALGETTFIDVLPHNGDGRGTDFDGAFGFDGAQVIAGTDTTIEYTTDAVATVDVDPATNTSTWVEASAYVGDLADVTAIRIRVADLSPGEVGAVRIFADPSGNAEGDLYRNQVGAGRAENLAQAIPPTLVSQIRVVASSIGDRVWHDLNSDGVQDVGEPGLEGVTVVLLDENGAELDTTTTGPDGIYTFPGYHSDTYRVQVDTTTLPFGYAATYDLDGGTASPDSDSQNFTLDIDVDRTDVDFGYVRQTAQLSANKVVEDDGAGWFGDDQTFELEVTCETDGVADEGFPQTVEITGSGSEFITVPVGSTCSVEETEDGGATEVNIDPETVFIDEADEVFTLSVENVFSDGSLVIRKSLSGAGVVPFAGDEFVFDVTCTFEGDTVYDEEVTLTRDGESTTISSETITGIPVGSECTITETAASGSDSLASPVLVTIVDDEQILYADATNYYSAGAVSLAKVLAGEGSESEAATSAVFDVLVTCQLDVEGDLVTLYSETMEISGGETVIIEVDGEALLLPLGARCFGEETDAGAATESTVQPDTWETGVEVTAGTPAETQQLEIVATNTFDIAELSVSKEVVGPGPAGPYEFTVTCTYEGEPYPLDETDAFFELSHGEERVIEVAPGVDCTATEADGAHVLVTYSDSDAESAPGTVEGIDGEASILVTNEFAHLEVTKTVIGGEPGPYSFTVTCTLDGQPYELDEGDSAFELSDGETRVIPVAPGVDCDVVEEDPGAAAVTYRLDGADVPDGTVDDVIGVQTLEITNEFAYLDVTKRVEGPGAAGPYHFEVTCWLGDGVYPLAPEDAAFDLSHGQTRTIGVAAGADCEVREVDAPAGATVRYIDSDDTSADGTVLDIHGTQSVTVTNTFAATGLLGSTGLDSRWPLGLAVMLLLAGLAAVVIRRASA
ncbi:hypothetical protein M2152_002075 [Microbacteriaceae bacterium SG_E_30_P1]|uniref:SdrD B-like protein n=1 Tax=Antiquaquibacter oligotrophicus TaxID=2880260 RepID=A0ABT6KPH8_9MICO|nr:DUF5979 domain-containing protein [Antiquaquibacter oligotrophicus]MDH6181893.1 hypothetical protein [Antiquaquibacter oligotrophicus]UDF12434.1 DUF5979 domain-containing protein [Antiquaquibacter oligotrophicus]